MCGSITKPCPYCGKPALFSPSKGLWCSKCKMALKSDKTNGRDGYNTIFRYI